MLHTFKEKSHCARSCHSSFGGSFTEFLIVIPFLVFFILAFFDLGRFYYHRGVALASAQQGLSLAQVIQGLDKLDIASSNEIYSFGPGSEEYDKIFGPITERALQFARDTGLSEYSAGGNSRKVALILEEPQHRLLRLPEFQNTGQTLEEALKNTPIDIFFQLRLEPVSPWFSEPWVADIRASGYREIELNTSIPVPLDCNLQPINSFNDTPPTDCVCPSDPNQTYNPSTNSCICPGTLIIDEDGQEICEVGTENPSCDDCQVYNAETQSCDPFICPEGFEPGTGEECCVCPNGINADGSCPTCPHGFVEINGRCTCPPEVLAACQGLRNPNATNPGECCDEAPDCPVNQVFNFETQECACPDIECPCDQIPNPSKSECGCICPDRLNFIKGPDDCCICRYTTEAPINGQTTCDFVEPNCSGCGRCVGAEYVATDADGNPYCHCPYEPGPNGEPPQRNCAADERFIGGCDCGPCPEGSIQDPNNPRNCICQTECGEGSVRPIGSCRCRLCVDQGENFVPNPEGNECICPDSVREECNAAGLTVRPGKCECQSCEDFRGENFELGDNGYCVCALDADACAREDQTFDSDRCLCVDCPDDRAFDASTGACSCPTDTTAACEAAGGTVTSSCSCLCPEGRAWLGDRCDCPSNFVHDGLGNCVCPGNLQPDAYGNCNCPPCPDGRVQIDNNCNCGCATGTFLNEYDNCVDEICHRLTCLPDGTVVE